MSDKKFDEGTINFKKNEVKEAFAVEILQSVYNALEEKGYNPINQLVGYLMSGEPTYITSSNDARNLITKIDRDELIEVILCDFLQKIEKKSD